MKLLLFIIFICIFITRNAAKYKLEDGYILTPIKNQVIYESENKVVGMLKLPFEKIITKMIPYDTTEDEKMYPHEFIKNIPYELILENIRIKQEVDKLCKDTKSPDNFNKEASIVKFMKNDEEITTVDNVDYGSNLKNDSLLRQELIKYLFEEEYRNEDEMITVINKLGFSEYIKKLVPKGWPKYEFSVNFEEPLCDKHLSIYSRFTLTFGSFVAIMEGHFIPYFSKDYKYLIVPKMDNMHWITKIHSINLEKCNADSRDITYCSRSALETQECNPTKPEKCIIDVHKVEEKFVWYDNTLFDPHLIATVEKQMTIYKGQEVVDVQSNKDIVVAQIPNGQTLVIGGNSFDGVSNDIYNIHSTENTKDIKFSEKTIKTLQETKVIKNVYLKDVIQVESCWCPFRFCCSSN